jgi:hypothetical protein
MADEFSDLVAVITGPGGTCEPDGGAASAGSSGKASRCSSGGGISGKSERGVDYGNLPGGGWRTDGSNSYLKDRDRAKGATAKQKLGC